MAKEKELQDLQRKEDAATDPDTKRALAYVMEVAVDALKGRFQREDVPGLKKYVLLERRRVAIELGWCSRNPSSNDSKHLVPTAISERAGLGRRPRDVHYTIDSPFTAPFSSTQPNKHPKEENQEERPI